MYFNSVRQGHRQEMRELKNSDAFKRKSRRRQEKDVKALQDRQRAAKEKAWKNQQLLTKGQIIMDTAGAIMGIWKDVPKGDFWSSSKHSLCICG